MVWAAISSESLGLKIALYSGMAEEYEAILQDQMHQTFFPCDVPISHYDKVFVLLNNEGPDLNITEALCEV